MIKPTFNFLRNCKTVFLGGCTTDVGFKCRIACVPTIIHPPLAKYVSGIRLGTENPAVSNKDKISTLWSLNSPLGNQKRSKQIKCIGCQTVKSTMKTRWRKRKGSMGTFFLFLFGKCLKNSTMNSLYTALRLTSY